METTQTVTIETKDVREYRRVLAWNLFCQGKKQVEIARILDVTEGAISQWIKRAQQHGVQSLKTRIAKGREPYLTKEQKAQLPDLLKLGAEHYGFRGDFWVRARIAEVIRREFDVSFCVTHISRLCKEIGWSCQKPVKRAIQRDEEKIARWKEETLPKIKKKRKMRSAPSFI